MTLVLFAALVIPGVQIALGDETDTTPRAQAAGDPADPKVSLKTFKWEKTQYVEDYPKYEREVNAWLGKNKVTVFLPQLASSVSKKGNPFSLLTLAGVYATEPEARTTNLAVKFFVGNDYDDQLNKWLKDSAGTVSPLWVGVTAVKSVEGGEFFVGVVTYLNRATR